MQNGKVKWFNESKGFGFIQTDEGSDVFVHHTGIVGSGFKTLREDSRVEFETEESDKGPRAVSVREI